MHIFNFFATSQGPFFYKNCIIGASLTLFALFFVGDVSAQACSGISFSFEQYEDCKFRAKYDNSTDCFIEIRYLLQSGTFSSWNVNAAAGFTVDVISPSELWIHHNQGFVPLGNQVPLLFTLPNDLNTTMDVAYIDACAQLGCEAIGFPIESCPDPRDASIIGVKYRECGSLPYTNQTIIPDWTIQLLNFEGIVIDEQVTDAGGAYAFYDLPLGQYFVKEAVEPGWTSRVPINGQYTVDLAPSQQVTRNFGNCPGCSCDSIYMDVVQLPGSSDSCAYALNLTNTGAYCFNKINISLSSGIFASTTPIAGWEVVVIDSQHVELTPFNGGWSGAIVMERMTLTGADMHDITVSTFYNVGLGNVNCSRGFSFPCPPPSSPAPCCPGGNGNRIELVLNGNFQLGNQDFTNDYTYFSPGGSTMTGKYSVLTLSQVFTANNQWSCSDHTSIGGNMLIVDGYAGPIAWQQTVNVTAGANYAYSAWFNNLVRPPKDQADPQMGLFVDNTMIAGPLTLPETPDQWVRLCGTWTAMATGPVTLSIRMLTSTNIGNDVAIDDISFSSCTPPTLCQTSVNVTQNPDCTVTVCAETMGAQPVTYQWCDGRTDICFQSAQLPCVPVTYCVTATCSNGTTSTASVVFTAQDLIPPVITCPANMSVNGLISPNGLCSAPFVPATPTANDNCDPSVTVTYNAPTVLLQGSNTIVWKATDDCGNQTTCSQIVTVLCGCDCVGNLVTNGGFENGTAGSPNALNQINQCSSWYAATNNPPANNIGDWYSTSNPTFPGFYLNPNQTSLPAHCGEKYAGFFLSTCEGITTQLSQAITQGCSYEVGFWWTPATTPTAPFSFIAVMSGGSCTMFHPTGTCSHQCNGDQHVIVNVSPSNVAGTWYYHSMTVTNAYPNVGYMTFTAAQGAPNVNNYIFVDDVCVKKIAEPCSVAASIECNPQNPTAYTAQATLGCGSVVTQVDWYFDGVGPNPSSPNLVSVVHPFNTLGLHTVCLVVTASNGQASCRDTICKEVFTDHVPPTKCDSVGIFLNEIVYIQEGPCCYQLFVNNMVPNYFSQIELTLSSGTFANSSLSDGTFTVSGSGNHVILTPISGFIPTGLISPYRICEPGGTNPHILDVKLLSGPPANDTCHTSFEFSCYTAPPPDSCCANFDAFCQKVENAVNILVNNEQCKANFLVGSLPDCDYIKDLDFGDGTPVVGPLLGGDISMHTYQHGGTYFLSWVAIEVNPHTGEICFEKILHDTITVNCMAVCPSCPPNTIQGPELISNGDFSKGYNQFYTDFRPKIIPGTSTVVGGFSVPNGSQIPMANTNWACFDHTTGLPSDKFLVCDGPAATSVNTNAWKGGVQVKPGRHYSFCMFVNNLTIVPPTPGDYTDPEVEILINSVVVAGPITVPESPDQWVLISVPWDAGINTLALIEIRSVASGSTGNDLAIDDVSFRECMTDTCYCGPFADMVVRWPQGSTGNTLTCGDTLAVTCEAGLIATFTGTFICNGSACSENPPVDWVLLDPSSNVIASGTTSAVPYFGMALPPSYFRTSGVYKLQLTGHCGSGVCSCTIFLSVQACLDPCACDAAAVQSFQSGANKGFANVLWNNSCKACFSPLALNDCETVEWKVNGISVGTSVGNQPFCQNFPNADTYTITMIATRKKSSGGVCETFSKSQNVHITCSVPDECPNTIVPNPQFSQGASFGCLNIDGISDGWSGPIGNPYILTSGVEMTLDSSVVFLWGNNDISDVLSRDTSDCWPKDTGMISLRTKEWWFIFTHLPPIENKLKPMPVEDPPLKIPTLAAPHKPGESFHLQLYNGEVSNLDCGSDNCFELASFLLPEPDTMGTWFTIELPYDTRIWDPTGTGGGCTQDPTTNLPGVAARPAIYITNWLGNNQGDSRSAMMVDGICFKSATVEVPVISLAPPTFRIFPNPNGGTFTMELSQPAKPGMAFRIINLIGQMLREQTLQAGVTMQTVQAGDLPAGLYFLQIVSEGKVLAVEKFVKE